MQAVCKKVASCLANTTSFAMFAHSERSVLPINVRAPDARVVKLQETLSSCRRHSHQVAGQDSVVVCVQCEKHAKESLNAFYLY